MQAQNNAVKDIERLYLTEQINQLARQSRYVLISAFVALLFVMYVAGGTLETSVILIWSSLVLTANFLLFVWHSYYQRIGVNVRNVYKFLYSYQVQSIAHGLIWGALPFILAEVKSAEIQLLAYYVLCGMGVGAIATTGMIYRIYLSFMLPVLLPIILYQIVEQNNAIFDNGGLGILIIFLFTMLSLSYAHYESVLRGIRLMFENDKLVDDLRIAYQRAEKANKAKTDFLSNMSHELRTPLNAIMGFSSLLIAFSRSKRPDKTREFAGNINEAGKHLSALINQVLDLTSIETGDTRVDLRAQHLTKIMQECIQLLRPLAETSEVKLIYNKDSDNAKYVLADSLRLRQVLINLISNAIKYNVKGGSVRVRCITQNSGIMVEIADTGLGIAKADQSSIFTPFCRAHMDAHVEGTGIGLSVTKKNLGLMNSKISFQSIEGEGSRFWFALPVVSEPENHLIPTSEFSAVILPSQRSGIKLLYIEDNPLGMRLMEEVMAARDDITFYQATTGTDGYELARDVEPHIIILDINLPDIDGLEVMRRILLDEKTRGIPVVALSASTLNEDVEKGMQAGFASYLRKPCEPDELLGLVYELTSVKH